MNKQRLTIIGTTLILALLLSGCEEYATYTPDASDLTRISVEWPDDDPNKPTVQAIALQRYGTAVAAEAIAEQAQLTVDAANAQADQQRTMLTAEAGLTAEALNVRATTDALNIQATREAMAINATRTAEARMAAEMATRDAVQATETQQAYNVQATATVDARNAQSTTDARNATATAISATVQAAAVQSTETMQAHKDNVTLTAISATAQAVTLQAKQAQMLYPFKVVGSILLTITGAMCVGFLGWRIAKVIEDRSRVIRRRPDEGESFVVLGDDRFALPLRANGPVLDATYKEERVPQLSSPEMQEAATMRQQTANAIQARLAGEIARARAKFPTLTRKQQRQLPQTPMFKPARLRTASPGLVDVMAVNDLTEATKQGVLSPQLAQAIEGQWTTVPE